MISYIHDLFTTMLFYMCKIICYFRPLSYNRAILKCSLQESEMNPDQLDDITEIEVSEEYAELYKDF
jgi:hypothetical protein